MLRHIRALAQFDRVMCSDGYDRAMDYVEQHLECPKAWVTRERIPPGAVFWGWTVPASLNHWKDHRASPRLDVPVERPMNLLHVRIPGRDPREVLLVAHLCHPRPSANDNASGCAMLIELIRHYAEHPPHFTLRFLFTVEYWGTVAFCASHEAELEKIIAGISVDMVGASQDLCGGTMIVDEVPDHLTSNLDLTVWDALNAASRTGRYRALGKPVKSFRCDFQYYTGGSDHYILNDATVGIPATAVGTYPDRFYHTPEDTLDKISTETLALFWSAIVGGLAAFSDCTESGATRRARLVLRRFDEMIHDHLLTLGDQDDDATDEEQMFRLSHAYKYARTRLGSDGTLHVESEPQRWLDALEGRWELVRQEFTRETGRAFVAVEMGRQCRGRRLFKGPLSRNNLYARLDARDRARCDGWLSQDGLFFHKLDAALNYSSMYGVKEIALLLRLHYGGASSETVLMSALDVLEQHDLVELSPA